MKKFVKPAKICSVLKKYRVMMQTDVIIYLGGFSKYFFNIPYNYIKTYTINLFKFNNCKYVNLI